MKNTDDLLDLCLQLQMVDEYTMQLLDANTKILEITRYFNELSSLERHYHALELTSIHIKALEEFLKKHLNEVK